jgi:hypothetical protein
LIILPSFSHGVHFIRSFVTAQVGV